MMLDKLKNGATLIEVFNRRVKELELNHVEKTLLVNVVDSLYVKHGLVDFTNLDETGYYHLVDSAEEHFDDVFNQGGDMELFDEDFCNGLMEVANELNEMSLSFITDMRSKITRVRYTR